MSGTQTWSTIETNAWLQVSLQISLIAAQSFPKAIIACSVCSELEVKDRGSFGEKPLYSLIYHSLHGGGLYSGSLSVIFSMASFDLRPPPLWGDFDFDFGCLLGGGPPCLLEVGLHLKGKGCIATRREVTAN